VSRTQRPNGVEGRREPPPVSKRRQEASRAAPNAQGASRAASSRPQLPRGIKGRLEPPQVLRGVEGCREPHPGVEGRREPPEVTPNCQEASRIAASRPSGRTSCTRCGDGRNCPRGHRSQCAPQSGAVAVTLRHNFMCALWWRRKRVREAYDRSLRLDTQEDCKVMQTSRRTMKDMWSPRGSEENLRTPAAEY